MGVFAMAIGPLGLAPAMDGLEVHGLERAQALPLNLAAGGWAIESLALTALFLLIQGRAGAWWLDGVVAGLLGWTFRGPVLVLSVVALSRLGPDPWWPMSLRWLVLYVVCGVALAIVARSIGLRR